MLNRRPDVVLYRCLDAGERLRAEHAQLIIQIVSPGSQTTDEADKHGEYARAAVPRYWIVRLDATGDSVVERYQFDHATSTCRHVGALMEDEPGSAPMRANPIPITIGWVALEY